MLSRWERRSCIVCHRLPHLADDCCCPRVSQGSHPSRFRNTFPARASINGDSLHTTRLSPSFKCRCNPTKFPSAAIKLCTRTVSQTLRCAPFIKFACDSPRALPSTAWKWCAKREPGGSCNRQPPTTLLLVQISLSAYNCTFEPLQYVDVDGR
jgi:hypothetical protein